MTLVQLFLQLLALVLATARSARSQSPLYDHELHHIHVREFNSTYKGDPQVFIIGVQRGGTHLVHTMLVSGQGHNPLFHDCGEIEPQIFTHRFNDYCYSKFTNQLELARRRSVVRSLDSTSDYFTTPLALDNMVGFFNREHLRSKQFILVLREPAARLHAFYLFVYSRCHEGFDFDRGRTLQHWLHEQCNIKNMGAEEQKYRDRFEDWVNSRADLSHGYYLAHLKRWLEVIPRKQLFIINMESLVTNSAAIAEGLFEFLELSAEFSDRYRIPRLSEGCRLCSEPLSCALYTRLKSEYATKNSGLVELINSGIRPNREPHFTEFTYSAKCV